MTPTAPPENQSVAAASTPNFILALEYGIPGLASAYNPTGVTSIKLQPAFGIWGNIEPTLGQMNFSTLDAVILEYQQAGFRDVQLLLIADNPWASISPATPAHPSTTNSFPQEQYLDEYVAFVQAVVERYDGDGQDDVIGLLYPVNRYALEAEFTGFWPGSASDYVRLLRLAYPAIHQANAHAELSLVAILVVDAFSGASDVASAAQRLQQPFGGRKPVADIETILQACDAYDVVDFHSLGDYSEIPLTTEWLRGRLRAYGCPEKPILIGDSFSMSALTGYVFYTFHPATPQNREAVVALLQAAADPAHPEYATAQSWLQAEMARNLVRKVVVAAANNLRGINMGNLEDWTSPLTGVNTLLATSVGASQFMGLMTTRKLNGYAGGPLPYLHPAFSRLNEPGTPRPAFYALALVNSLLTDMIAITPLSLGEGVWAYQFTTSAEPVWVLWYDDGQLHLPGEPLPAIEVTWNIAAANVRLTFTPTEPGQTTPSTTTVPTQNGQLTLNLGPTPIFVQPIPQP